MVRCIKKCQNPIIAIYVKIHLLEKNDLKSMHKYTLKTIDVLTVI